MLKRTKALVVTGALVMALPAGAALADTDIADDVAVATVTCDGSQQQLRSGGGPGMGDGECTGDFEQAKLMNQEHKQFQARAEECDGEGPGEGFGLGNGPGEGFGPGDGSGAGDGTGLMNGAGQQHRANS